MVFLQGDYETAAKMYKRATDIKDQSANPAFTKAPSVKSSDDSVSTLRNIGPLHEDL